MFGDLSIEGLVIMDTISTTPVDSTTTATNLDKGQKATTNRAFADTVVDATDDAIVGTADNQSATIGSWNPGAEQLYGYPADEVIGQPFSILEPEESAGVEATRKLNMAAKQSDKRETVRRRKDGTRVHVRSWLTAVKNACGQVIGYSSIARDITERRSAERELRQGKSRYQGIVQAATEGIWVIDTNNNTDFINGAMAGMLGYTVDKMKGKSLFEFMDNAETLVASASLEQRTYSSGTERDVRLIRKNGDDLWAILSIAPLVDDDGVYEGTLMMVTDVSDRRREADRQNRFLRDVLASATDGHLFLCSVSEELPSPLTPLFGPVALSKSDGMRELRHEIREASNAAGLSDERCIDLVTAVGEASLNAVCHAGAGIGQVFVDRDRGTVQASISDFGSGITVENLPRATLKRGYSSAGTLGHGFKMILQTTDRVYLLTRNTGTTIVLEQDRVTAEPEW